MNTVKTLIMSTSLFALMACSTTGSQPLDKILSSDHRAESASRDQYRNPKATLDFFEVSPEHTVVEIWPGGGWYTQVLAPYLKDQGTYYAAHFDPQTPVEYFQRSRQNYEDHLTEMKQVYGDVKVTVFNPSNSTAVAPEGTADRVLTFRNVHNWYMRGGGDEQVISAFKAFHKALKPGGILGVVEHRLPEDKPAGMMERSGYMHQDYVIDMAEKAGFTLVDSSEINANPKDTADHPKGVWTLPPSLRLGEQDREKYLAIGESDRMTLKFRK
ncbi:class I SAM-dependent methyltransferase [Bermanella sp. R86510]|uniref:class I SAM-dependent methyltransferase n=1 Tax=unclassified Bermanella TaxID=2627862 RepID=UPI0037C88BE8